MNLRNIRILNNYAERVIQKNSKQLNKEDWLYVGKDIKTNKPEFNAVIAKRVIMSNLEIANKRVMDILTNNGINENKPFEIYKKAEQVAIEKDNSGDLIKIADRYIELFDLKPQKVTISESRQQINYDNMLPEKTKQTISTTKTVQKENNDGK